MSLLSIKSKIGIPSDWKMIPIGKVLISSQYGTSNGNSDTGVPVVGMKNLQDGKVHFNDLPFVSVDEAEKESLLLHDGDILLNRTNSYDLVGKVGFIDKAIEAVFASYLVRLEVDKTKSNLKFVAMWLSSFWADQMIKKIATRAVSQANVNPTEFKKFCLIPVLPLPEQKAIADLLSTWDEAIEKTERLIHAKERRFKWLLRELISEPRNMQKDAKWKRVKLGEVCKVITSNVDKKTSPEENPVRLCNYMDVYKNFYITNELDFMPASATASEIEKYQLQLHDVLLTKDSETPDDIANSACVLYAPENLLCGYHLAILRPKKNLFGTYLNFALHTPRIRFEFSRQANGATRFGLTMSAYNAVELPLPIIEEQKRISEILNLAQHEIDLLKQLAEKYKTQKCGLMQKMLTGEWRVKPEIVKQYVEA